MESPNLQSPAAPAVLPDCCQHDGIPGEKLALLSSALHSVHDQGQNGGDQPLKKSSTGATIALSSLLEVTSS